MSDKKGEARKKRKAPGSAEARTAEAPTIAERLSSLSNEFSAADRKVARTLRADYPSAGLKTVMSLAEEAAVSSPSVIRFVKKLGFKGFSEFQKALRDEIQTQLQQGPVSLYSARFRTWTDGDPLLDFFRKSTEGLDKTMRRLSKADFDGAASLLANKRSRIHCCGGRFSRYLAGYLHAHLHQLRPNTTFLTGSPTEWREKLPDVSRRDTIVAFDLRRYQDDVIDFAFEAQRCGASIILFTDFWKSPISRCATFVLSGAVEVPSPWDSALSVLFLVEALIADVTGLLGGPAIRRLKSLDDFGVRQTRWRGELQNQRQR